MNPPHRYDQASALPFRRRDRFVEYCLITSRRKRHWIFPKGIVDPGETPEETALKEAREEAGLHGLIRGQPLGSYRYHKWDTDLDVLVLLMEVLQVDRKWDEALFRQRTWVRREEADRLIVRQSLRHLLHEADARLAPTGDSASERT